MSKCAIAPTDREWFASLQRNYTSGEVNFWTPTPWNVKGLLPRERLYFLHKAPVRKICGYGEFVRYENMSVSEAWDEFGRNNGVDSVDELVRKAGHYVEAHTPRTGTSDRSEIGCIVLDSVVLLDEEDYFDPADQDLDFAPQVVKIKYFDSDPGIPGHRGKINMIVISVVLWSLTREMSNEVAGPASVPMLYIPL